MKIYKNLFNQAISNENLFHAWDEFKKDKQSKTDVRRFEQDLEKNIFELHRDLESKNYRHGEYSPFYIQDPKQRLIHKASVRDRILHHAVFNALNPIFEETFISESFSCRIGKGTHKGVDYVAKILRKAGANGTKPCFALKCDIKKFFASVDHKILLSTIGLRIKDEDALWLIKEIVGSFHSTPPPRSLTVCPLAT